MPADTQKTTVKVFPTEDKLFMYMRGVVLGAALGLLLAARLMHHFPFTLANVRFFLPLFIGWSFLAAGVILADHRIGSRRTTFWKRLVVGAALLVDGAFIYYASKYSGGLGSPFFPAAYVLIVYHAYYFPTYLPHHMLRRWRWLVSGAALSPIVFFILYAELSAKRIFTDIDFYIEGGLALMIAVTAGILRNLDRKANRTLRRKNEMAQLFQGIIQTVNQMSLSESTEMNYPLRPGDYFANINVDHLARTIGENLGAQACEVFTLQMNLTFTRQGLWIRKEALREDFCTFLENQKTVRFAPDYQIRSVREFRTGRIEKTRPGRPALTSPLSRQMKEFFEHDLLHHCLFSLILRKTQRGAHEPIGLIRLINRVDSDLSLHHLGFTEDDEEVIQNVAREISSGIENLRLQALLRFKLDKEKFLRKLALETELDKIFNIILQSMSELVNARFADLWIPFEEGFAQTPKLILRSYFAVEPPLRQLIEEMGHVLNIEESFIGSLMTSEDGKEIIYEEDICRIGNYAWAKNIEKFGTRKFIAVRLLHDGRAAGMVCLHPAENFSWNDEVRESLSEYAHLAMLSIQGTRYRRRFQQLTDLQKNVDILLRGKARDFYQDIVALFGRLMRAEICGFYTLDPEQKRYLLANEKIEDGVHSGGILGLSLDAQDYTLTQLAIAAKPVVLYGNPAGMPLPQNFFRSPLPQPISMILALLVGGRHEIMGLICCVNKVKDHDIISGAFTRVDAEAFALAVEIVTAILDNRANLDRLRAMDRQKQNFLSSVSHEFNTPLHSMRNTVEFLRRFHNNPVKLKDPQSKFQVLLEEIDHLTYLIANIRNLYAENLSDVQTPRFEETNLFKLVEKIQTLMKGHAQEKGLKMRLIGEFPTVIVDRFQVEQVIFNLLMNAVKYTRKGTEKPIEIICERRTTDLLITVRNWGIGIRADEATRIFEMFERGVLAYKTAVSGSGLGLYISRRIMQNLSGDLKLTKLQDPTEFTLFLPLKTAASPANEGTAI